MCNLVTLSHRDYPIGHAASKHVNECQGSRDVYKPVCSRKRVALREINQHIA